MEGYNCYKCGVEFEPSESQIKKRYFICKSCRKEVGKEYRQKCKSRGLKISGSQMPREYHRQYEKEYYQDPMRVIRRRLEYIFKKRGVNHD